MFATLTLRRSIPISLPTWGAIGGFTMVVGFGAAIAPLVGGTRASIAKAKAPVARTAFDNFVLGNRRLALSAAFDSASDVVVAGHVAAIVRARETSIAFVDARTGKALGIFPSPTDSSQTPRPQLAVAPVDSGRWAILDRSRGTIEIVRPSGARVNRIALPRGAWSRVVWDGERARFLVAGLKVGDARTATDGRSVHEFDAQGVETGAHRDIAPISHRLQASFNMPFFDVDGSVVVSGSSLSNEVLLFDRASAHERVVRVADDWFTPIDWDLPHQTTPAKSIAEPTLRWLSSQTMLTGVIATTNGRFVARFTQHGSDRDRYVYALVDSVGRTRTLSQPTTVKLERAAGDTISGFDVDPDGRTTIFVGVLAGG